MGKEGEVGGSTRVAGRTADRSPTERGGYWAWTEVAQGAAVVFSGRGPAGGRASREEILARITGRRRPLAWARQVHSARVLPARPGKCGDGDALVSGVEDVALSIGTADCVPVLAAGPAGIAAAPADCGGLRAR